MTLAIQYTFDGSATLLPKQKAPKPKSVGGRLLALMLDGQWRTLWEMQTKLSEGGRASGSQTALSARLRDFRKLGYRVEGRTQEGKGRGSIQYRVSEGVKHD